MPIAPVVGYQTVRKRLAPFGIMSGLLVLLRTEPGVEALVAYLSHNKVFAGTGK